MTSINLSQVLIAQCILFHRWNVCILLIGSLVGTVSSIAEDAFDPCALSNCSTVPLPRWRTESRPCRHSRPTPAVYGPDYLAVFAQFPNKRLIAVGKFERNVKCHLSMSSKLGFRVPRWNRNDTFLRAFVKSLLFFASRRASAVGNAVRDSTSWGWHRARTDNSGSRMANNAKNEKRPK